MGDNLTMARPGHAVTMDGLDLSWPIGGERQVVKFPDELRTRRILTRIANGAIVETDDPVTKVAEATVRELRLYEGEEALKIRAEPAGIVTRQQADPVTKKLLQVPIRSMDMPREGEDTTPDITEMTKAELVAYAESLGLPTSGSKAEIIERIEGADVTDETETTEETTEETTVTETTTEEPAPEDEPAEEPDKA